MRRPLLLGHRGARLCAPENTFDAFDQALAHGCDGFEFDVRRTADCRGFICHDPRFYRLAIARNTYATLLGRAAPNPQPCCLEEVLRRYSTTAFLDIELKDLGLEDLLVRLLCGFPPKGGYVISSFLPDVITALHDRKADIPLGLIADQRRALERWRDLPVRYVMPQRSLASRTLVEELHAAGKQVFVWTVNDQRTMRRLAEYGVDGIISDDTELLSCTFHGS